MNGVIIQARTGSTRLRNKVLMEIGRRSMLARVVDRVQMAKLPEEIVVATSVLERDNRIVTACMELDVPVFRGSETDVLDRVYQCAERFNIDPIVRITADCPLIDPAIIDQTIDLFHQASWEWTASTLQHPDGMDVECVSFVALEDAWKNATDPADREHVTGYIRKHYIGGMVVSKLGEWRHLHWSVDTEEDLEFVRLVYSQLGENFTYEDVLKMEEAQR